MVFFLRITGIAYIYGLSSICTAMYIVQLGLKIYEGRPLSSRCCVVALISHAPRRRIHDAPGYVVTGRCMTRCICRYK